MGNLAPGIHSGRLAPQEYDANFSDLHPAYDKHEALVAADRCYFCYDAPCMTACPTAIDIPMFIREISTGNTLGAAKTIFDQNILGGMCARVCPTETLCEQACVRNTAEEKPVEIGRLQRYATDAAMAIEKQFYNRAPATGKKVAVIGAGPAGLAAAHRLALRGHSVTIYDAREKSGGLNEFGIAAYKTPGDFAQQEVEYIIGIGGIEIQNGKALGRDFSLDDLKASHDAVFLGVGLAAVNALATKGEEVQGVEDAVDFIANLRSSVKATVPVGRRVVVIGGGMTAVDAAIQSKLLGAEEVTMVYRRGKENMNASEYEQDLAASKGVLIRHWLKPREIIAQDGRVTAIELEYTHIENGALTGTGQTVTIACDQVLTAIGQKLDLSGINALKIEGGKITVDPEGRTTVTGVWAGGDCALGGDDLTVSAAAMGRDAAESINRALMA
ncbi:NAD(P)-dependent oxidoreductase [Rhizobium sp. LjRoot254]|uniref:NAD(P)-dependent oxidoreductase n=1 Tax=Rhizobium sp. LjRoot254 TaxID=3342297 RepID=UPI003ECFB4A1